MRNQVLTRLKTLLAATVASVYTKRRKAAKPKYSLAPATETDDRDAWLFDDPDAVCRETALLSRDMGRLSNSLSGLRETLDLMTGVTPFPSHTLTQSPCAKMLHDSDLFDGEPTPALPVQDTVIGGETAFLFGEEAHLTETARHAA
ncbi:MAG: hypothetical protein AAGJ85_00405 [Pseudomonadota bacterium]